MKTWFGRRVWEIGGRFLLFRKPCRIAFARGCVPLAFLALRLPSAVAADAPKAAIPEAEFTFKRVISGSVIEHDFVVKNEGSAPLRILNVKMTPPLLVTRMPREIAPGGEGTIHFKLDTASLAGQFRGAMLVVLNDPDLREASLTFEGQVVPAVELSPLPAFYVSAQRGQVTQSSIEIVNHEPEPLHIERVEHPTGRFTTTLETLDAGQRYRLTLHLKPDGPGGRSTETILVTTSSKVRPILKIAANTFLHERVYTFPDAIDLGALPIDAIRRNPKVLEQTAQTLMIYQADGSDFEAQLSTDVPACELKAVRGPKRDRYQATVTLIADELKPGPIKGSILIRTNDPQFPTLTVPVSGWILER